MGEGSSSQTGPSQIVEPTQQYEKHYEQPQHQEGEAQQEGENQQEAEPESFPGGLQALERRHYNFGKDHWLNPSSHGRKTRHDQLTVSGDDADWF